MPEKCSITVFGVDPNIELTDPMQNGRDHCIGVAMDAARRNANHYHETVATMVKGACRRLHNAFSLWWRTARTDEYGEASITNTTADETAQPHM